MDILLRGLDPVAIHKIDELAKKKGIPRAEYLRQLIHARAELEAVNDTSDRYERLIQSVLLVLGECSGSMERVGDMLERLETKLEENT